MQDMKMQDWKMADKLAGEENAELEISWFENNKKNKIKIWKLLTLKWKTIAEVTWIDRRACRCDFIAMNLNKT